MNSADFYFDEQRSRIIKLEWTSDFGQVNVFDNDELIHQHTNLDQLKKGIVLRTPNGENLRIRLFPSSSQWEVSFGDRYLINSYYRSEEVVKGTAQIFWYVFLASITYLMVLVLPQYKTGMVGLDVLLKPEMLIYLGLIGIFLTCNIMVKRGKLFWYYLGTILYLIDTIYVLIYTLIISELPINLLMKSNIGLILLGLLAIRVVFAYYLVNAFKHVIAFYKHKKELEKNRDVEILDV